MSTLLAFVTELSRLPKPVIDTGCSLIKDLFGYPCQAAGGLIGDSIYQLQCNRRVEIAAKAKQILDEKKIEPRVLPTGFLLDFFNEAGNVDDDEELKNTWARLLASAVESEIAAKKVYVNVLKQLGKAEIQLLEGFWQRQEPFMASRLQWADGPIAPEPPQVSVLMMLGVLERVPVPPDTKDRTYGGGQAPMAIKGLRLTSFAYFFLEAVGRRMPVQNLTAMLKY